MTDKPLHIQQAEGLRQLADMIENNPEIAKHVDYALRYMLLPASGNSDAREQLTTVATIAKTTNASVEISNDADSCHVHVRFGPVGIDMYANAARMAGLPQPKPAAYQPLVVED